jgi:glycosyltransferase involved in cell wall biosynthesis
VVAIVVPARDERDTIAACVRSIRDSLRAADVEGWTVVVADACSDDTAARARDALGRDGEVIECRAASVGSARRDGCERALRHYRAVSRRELVLMSTDADSIVGADWVSMHLAEIGRGAAAVAGTVVVDSCGDRHPQLRARFEHVYALRRERRHSHVHGANLSVVAEAYFAVGGFTTAATGEDHDLWARLRAGGYPTVSSTASPVLTSGRRFGRAPSGFAEYLNALERVVDGVSA